ncbi:hypothetical protein ES703_92949 [subsurface metagenome]
MTTSKKIFFKLVAPFNFLVPFRLLERLSACKIMVPLYHAVSNSQPMHLSYLYDIRDTRRFVGDMDMLLKYFKPVDLVQLLDILQNKKAINNPVFHLTFDDGLAEFDTVVAPILLKKGIPATCFLNSDFIDNKKMFFRFKASIIIDQLHNAEAGSEAWKKFHQWIKVNNLENKYYRKILLEIGYDKKHLLDELAKKLEIDFNLYLRKYKPYLEEKQITSLLKKGFTFGAHSTDHPEYRFIDEKEQIKQTGDSVEHITTTFDLPYKVFAFPFTDYGISLNFFEAVHREYNIDLTFGCAGIKQDAVPFNLQRMPVEEYHECLKGYIKKEYLYYQFLKLLGKGQIKRSK